MEVIDPNLGDYFCDKKKVPENTRILALSLLEIEFGDSTGIFHVTLCPVGKAINTELKTREDSIFEALSVMRAGKLVNLALLKLLSVCAVNL
ncbi:hypothetical protein AVEN_53530-1 [Araneus ventricosus]|uniref:Uncharacterized protein n=1 Tax=Araneus ventricosus TaxID=182803 RepID=A0A4Y2M952_ARAVE|nr:hypothetical protein AVEN_53530-1 [Araneus ventricosus]